MNQQQTPPGGGAVFVQLTKIGGRKILLNIADITKIDEGDNKTFIYLRSSPDDYSTVSETAVQVKAAMEQAIEDTTRSLMALVFKMAQEMEMKARGF